MLRYTYTACLVHFYVSSYSFYSLNCLIRGEIGSIIILSYSFTGWLLYPSFCLVLRSFVSFRRYGFCGKQKRWWRRRRQQQQQQQQPHRRYYPHNFNIYFFYIAQEKSNPHIYSLDGCDDVSRFTSMSSATFEAYKMPKTVQRQYGQRIYALFIFQR
jgi:hypothetical protein